MNTEPTRIVGLINAALAATIGVLTLAEVLSPQIGGALGLALGAWITVGHEILRGKVTPVEAPVLTAEQNAKVEVKG